MSTTPGGKGRFGDFDASAQSAHWDAETRTSVLARLRPEAELEFFTPADEPAVRALLDRLLAQDDEPKVPVAELIDDRLLRHEGDGYRYADMPEDWDAWKRSARALDAEAHDRHGERFARVGVRAQQEIIEAVRTAPGDWHGMPGHRVFELWMRYATTAFYSHPWAWNEIGFPGPAYPRGYKTLAVDRLEPFEERERDPRDPIPWAQKAEAARAAHLGSPPEPLEAERR